MPPENAKKTQKNSKNNASPAAENPQTANASVGLQPPSFAPSSESNIVALAKGGANPVEDPKLKATLDSAVEWGKMDGPDTGATQSLQGALGVDQSGDYNRATAQAVLDKQKELKYKGQNGKAEKILFLRLGLIYTKKTKDAVVEDDVKAQLMDPSGEFRDEFKNGFNLAFYTHYDSQSNNNKEFLRQAAPWAKRHKALGISGGKLTIGEPIKTTESGAIVEHVIQIANAVHEFWKSTAMGKQNSQIKKLIDQAKDFEPGGILSGPQEGVKDHYLNVLNGFQDSLNSSKPKINNLGIFTHGMTYGLGTDANETNSYKHGLLAHDYKTGAKSNVDDFAGRIKAHLSTNVKVQLFACNAGREFDAKDKYKKAEYKHWQTTQDGGENSFAAKLSESLGEDASVYAHLTAGHTTRNQAAVVFGHDAGDDNGTHIFNILYPESYRNEFLNSHFSGIPEDKKEAARVILRAVMSKHFKSMINKVIKVPNSDRDTNFGSEMFTDPDNSKIMAQKDFKTNYVSSDTYKTGAAKIKKLIQKKTD